MLLKYNVACHEPNALLLKLQPYRGFISACMGLGVSYHVYASDKSMYTSIKHINDVVVIIISLSKTTHSVVVDDNAAIH